MHRTIVLSGDPAALRDIAAHASGLEEVISVSHDRGTSIKPPGDVLVLQVLNKAADEVVRRATGALLAGTVAMAVSESKTLVDPPRHGLIARDADEALWEEMQSALRNHGRVSVNFIVLMALGGLIAAIGLEAESVQQAIAFVGASIVAPGFEPIAKIALGVGLRQTRMIGMGATALVVGYLVLMLAAALTFVVLARAGLASPAALLARPSIRAMVRVDVPSIALSGAAAIAGTMMIVSLRDLYVIGPLLLLVSISGSALAGAALAAGRPLVALHALARVGLDVALVVSLGAAVFFWKQKRVHRRTPLP